MSLATRAVRAGQALRIAFHETARQITQPETKFGGSPVWVGPPQWPLSASTGRPMQFIGQVVLDPSMFPNAVARMAYVFMTDASQGDVDRTWDPDAGENAVILQPGSTSIAHAPLYTGPSVRTLVRSPVTGESIEEPIEYAADLTLRPEPAHVPYGQRRTWSDDEVVRYIEALEGSKIGGSPAFVQDDNLPFQDWRLLLQLDFDVPFSVNFGDGGCGYAIANADCTQARFLWQCS